VFPALAAGFRSALAIVREIARALVAVAAGLLATLAGLSALLTGAAALAVAAVMRMLTALAAGFCRPFAVIRKISGVLCVLAGHVILLD
jgi:hypothetical protein